MDTDSGDVQRGVWEGPVGFPPAPWRLRGVAIHSLQLMPAELVQPSVPPEFRIVCIAPGRTLGGIAVARYGRGSALEYCELLAVPALAHAPGAGTGFWISHIWVDNQASVAGGRAIWGLPKEMADFEWDESSGEDVSVVVRQGEAVLCSVTVRMPRVRLPVPFVVPALTVRDGQPARFTARGRSLAGMGRAWWNAPESSPLKSLLPSLGSLSVCHDRLDALVHAPSTR